MGSGQHLKIQGRDKITKKEFGHCGTRKGKTTLFVQFIAGILISVHVDCAKI